MRAMTENDVTPDQTQSRPSTSAHQNITELSQTLFDSNAGHTCLIADLAAEASTLPAATLNELLEDQQCAYNIIDWHLGQHISGSRQANANDNTWRGRSREIKNNPDHHS